MKIFIKDFFSKFEQILSSLWTWSHLLKKSLVEDFIFCERKWKILCIPFPSEPSHEFFFSRKRTLIS